ncbi:hypothetical protein B0H12DRAFT_1130592 [Mycena haematopus]|nr:hypothetical protein B0H12DRAFT_1130592 [Mycena haematopus]
MYQQVPSPTQGAAPCNRAPRGHVFLWWWFASLCSTRYDSRHSVKLRHATFSAPSPRQPVIHRTTTRRLQHLAREVRASIASTVNAKAKRGQVIGVGFNPTSSCTPVSLRSLGQLIR